MRYARWLFFVFLATNIAFSTAQARQDNNTLSSISPEKLRLCDEGATKTQKQYNVVGGGTDVYAGPSSNHGKLINKKATELLGETYYISIDDTTIVFEECTKGEWSFIKVVEPDYLSESHRGWVPSNVLDKGQDLGDDPYIRTISSYAIILYDRENFPDTVRKYGSRLEEIETLRRRAAELAVDSGKCDFVERSELSDARSSLNHLHFWIDCRNGQRVRMDEFEIKQNKPALTEQDKAWDEAEALGACREAVKSRVLFPNELDFHTFFGTSVSTAPITSNVVVSLDFDAKNAFGVETGYTAKCIFEPGKNGDIEIFERR